MGLVAAGGRTLYQTVQGWTAVTFAARQRALRTSLFQALPGTRVAGDGSSAFPGQRGQVRPAILIRLCKRRRQPRAVAPRLRAFRRAPARPPDSIRKREDRLDSGTCSYWIATRTRQSVSRRTIQSPLVDGLSSTSPRWRINTHWGHQHQSLSQPRCRPLSQCFSLR